MKTADDLDYMHARYYAFNIGRFMTVDPARGTIGSSQSWDGYAYVRGNPVNVADPTGKKARVLNEEAFHLLEQELGADAKLLTRDKNGNLSLNATPEQLDHNEALKVLNDVIKAKEMYGITVSSVVRTRNGSIKLGPGGRSAINFSAIDDPTFSPAVNARLAPPAGFDAVIALAPRIQKLYEGAEVNKGKPVSAIAVLFHETAEAFGRTSERMPRNIAHQRAIWREMRWRQQDNRLTGYALGAGPIRLKR